MAYRSRRRGRRFGGRRGAGSQFAGRRVGGRAQSWENPVSVDTIQAGVFPEVAYAPAANRTVRFRRVVDTIITGDVCTVVRIKGVSIPRVLAPPATPPSFETPVDLDLGANAEGIIVETLELATVRDGDIVLNAVLNPANTQDMESSQVLWRRWHNIATWRHGPIDQNFATWWSPDRLDCENPIDIKTKRTWDRQRWALVHVINHHDNIAVNAGAVWSVDWRLLMRTNRGI